MDVSGGEKVEKPRPTLAERYGKIAARPLPEKIGWVVGEVVGTPSQKYLEKKVSEFDLDVRGQEHLVVVQNGSCIIAGNHEKPIPPAGKPVSIEGSKVSPDSFIIRRLVEKTTNGQRRLRFVGHYNLENPGAGDKLVKGWYEGNQIIPVTKRRRESNRDLVQGVRDAFAVGDSILMYPEGRWYNDFSLDNPFHTGTATFACKYEKPILPFYIHGAKQWVKGQKVVITFGPPIDPRGKTAEQITEELKASIHSLQQQVSSRKSTV